MRRSLPGRMIRDRAIPAVVLLTAPQRAPPHDRPYHGTRLADPP
ncbi:hypothetical protein [Streptosporangium sp. KLBMP 9127]